MKKWVKNITAAALLGGISGDGSISPTAQAAPPDTPVAKANGKIKKHAVAKLTIAQRSELIIDSILTVMENTGMAPLAADVPGIGFSSGKPGEYASGTDAITAESIRQVRIDTGDGRIRYFKRAAVADNLSKTHVAKPNEPEVDAAERRAIDSGFRASAWQETDKNGVVLSKEGKSGIRFCFPGFMGSETAALIAILPKGELNPQVHAVPAFVNATLDKVYGPERKNIGTAHVAGCSMGASNGLVAQRCLLIGEVPCDPMTVLEPFAASLALDHINRELQWPGSLLSQNISRFSAGALLGTGAETIANPNMSSVCDHSYRSVIIGKDGEIKTSMVATLKPGGHKGNNAMVGQEFAIDMTGYRNIYPVPDGLARFLDPCYLDPLHMNGNIATQLIAQNQAAVAAGKSSPER